MNRNEFMNKLEKLLLNIPFDEKKEALQYYTDYFEDAGEENEMQVIEELGSPQKVAETIMAELKNGNREHGEFTENGYSDSRFEKRDDLIRKEKADKKAGSGYTYHSTGQNNSFDKNPYTENSKEREKPRTSRTLKIILIILIALTVIPVAWPVLIGCVAVVIGVVCAAFGLFAGLLIGSVALMAVGFIIFIFGLTKLLAALPIALLTSGSGLIIFVLGLIATAATVKLCMIVYPAMVRGIVAICRWPFHRRAVS
jgi:uncharacterized membrane protein